MSLLSNKSFVRFVVIFLIVFAALYLGTLAVIGLAAPGKLYSPFIDHYLDYVSGIKYALMFATKAILSLFGIETVIEPGFLIRFIHARGVIVAMDCVGYGVYSFWIAFVVANKMKFFSKLAWVVAGVLLLFIINVVRITLFLTAINRGWSMPLGIDHHTWFTICAYLAIFALMWRFEHNLKRQRDIALI